MIDVDEILEHQLNANMLLMPYHVYSELFDSVAALGDENAELRTFIGLKETCWKYVGRCDECPYNGVDDEHDDCNCTIHEQVSSLARELGIEAEP